MSVRENLAFPLRQQKAEEQAITTQVAWSSDLLGLNPYLDRSPAELSAANDSASRWGAPSFGIQPRSSWTNRSRISTRAFG